jgi:hypothetical protein
MAEFWFDDAEVATGETPKTGIAVPLIKALRGLAPTRDAGDLP